MWVVTREQSEQIGVPTIIGVDRAHHETGHVTGVFGRMTLQAFIAADELWTSGAGLVENVEDSSPHGVNPGQLERFATTNPANIGVVIKKIARG